MVIHILGFVNQKCMLHCYNRTGGHIGQSSTLHNVDKCSVSTEGGHIGQSNTLHNVGKCSASTESGHIGQLYTAHFMGICSASPEEFKQPTVKIQKKAITDIKRIVFFIIQHSIV